MINLATGPVVYRTTDSCALTLQKRNNLAQRLAAPHISNMRRHRLTLRLAAVLLGRSERSLRRTASIVSPEGTVSLERVEQELGRLIPIEELAWADRRLEARRASQRAYLERKRHA